MIKRELKNRHFYHIVNNSPWPLLISFTLLGLTSGTMFWFHQNVIYIFFLSFCTMIYIMFLWFRDVIREGTFEGNHTKEVQSNLKFGMFLFILSEVMFFFSFFWTFFHSSLAPSWEIGIVWPPIDIVVLDTWRVPALNTIISLTSGAAITWAHYALILGKRYEVIQGFCITIFLAILFTLFQMMEYFSSLYHLYDGIYGSIFFIITGFHGLHVLIGTCFLLICFFRFLKFHFTSNHHIGFQSASWYWHFVDVIWILLFISVYFWGNFFDASEIIEYSYSFIKNEIFSIKR